MNTWAKRNPNVSFIFETNSFEILPQIIIKFKIFPGCCIYKKPTVFGESSSEDDEECENCFGHPEKRRRNRKHDEHNHDENDASPNQEQNDASTN